MAEHISNIQIVEFRQLKDIRLDGLKRINVFVGENNSGKTSVLEAISLFCRPLDPLAWISVGRNRETKSSRESILDNVRWLFPQKDAELQDPFFKGQIQILGDGNFACTELLAEFEGYQGDQSSDSEDEDEDEDPGSSEDQYESKSESSESWDASASVAEIYLKAKVPQLDWMVYEADPNTFYCEYSFELWQGERFRKREKPVGPLLDTATISPFSHRVERTQTKALTNLTLKDAKFNVLQCIRKIDEDIEDIEILSPTGIGSSVYLKRKGTGFTPLSSMGDGVRRIFAIAIALASVQNGAIFIDEIETAIHKSALFEVFQWLVGAAKHFNVQVFASTHSLETIDAILGSSLGNLDDLVVYQLPESGLQEVKRFNGEVLENIRFEQRLDVR